MGYKKDMSKYENLEGWERCGFGEQLDRWAEKYGERIAVTDSEDEISYMELKQKADCLAAAFLRKGILKGDKVLVQLPNRISFVIVFFALSKIGAVPIMMLPAHREAELEGIIELAKPAAYIVVEKYLGFSYVPMANAMKEKYSCIRHIFVDSESGDISGMIAETYGENGAFPAVDGYETAVLLLSGGTTGVPKLIPRTHTDYMYNARMSAKRCRLDSGEPKGVSRAWKVLVNRHEMLRAKVTEVRFEILERDEIDYEIKIVNLQKMAEREKVDTLSKIREDFSEYVFHTEEPPLFKVLITKRIEGNFFHLLVDLIVSDFASVQLLISEMGELLKGASLEKIRYKFSDYAMFNQQRKGSLKWHQDRMYWLERLKKLPEAPILPQDGRAADKCENTYEFYRFQKHINQSDWKRIKEIAGEYGVTVSSVLIGIYFRIWNTD